MEIYKETSQTSDLKFGRLMVGLSPVPLSMTTNNVVLNKIKAQRGFLIRNLSSDQPVYIGNETVTTQNGFVLGPNDSMTVPVDDPALLYLVADDANVPVCWMLA